MKKDTKTAQLRKWLIGFTGWCDAGNVVNNMVEHILSVTEAQKLDEWDLESYWHIESERPYVVIKHGLIRNFAWPAMSFYRLESKGKEIGLALSAEPSRNWKHFAKELIERIEAYGGKQVIMAGSLYDKIFHDETIISGVVPDPESLNLVLSAGCKLVEYEGPAAVHTAVMEEARRRGIVAISLWIHVPFYLKGPHEKAMAQLLDVLGRISGVFFDTGDLLDRWAVRVKNIEKILEEDEELRSVLEALKEKEKEEKSPSKALPATSSMTTTPAKPKVIRIDEFIRRRKGPSEGDFYNE